MLPSDIGSVSEISRYDHRASIIPLLKSRYLRGAASCCVPSMTNHHLEVYSALGMSNGASQS